MKRLTLVFFLLLTGFAAWCAEPVTGLWKSVDDESGLPKSITLIYEYSGKVYGRVIATFDDRGILLDSLMNPVEKAVNVAGEPFYSGLDIIWEMEEVRTKWSRGKIMDPEPARVYACDLWIEKGNLVVRGKIGPFGRNQTWLPVAERDLPAGFVLPRNPVPVIPKAK